MSMRFCFFICLLYCLCLFLLVLPLPWWFWYHEMSESRESEWEKLQVCRPLSGCNTMENMGLKCWTSPKACWCRRSGDQEDSAMCHELGDLNGWIGKFIVFPPHDWVFPELWMCVCVCRGSVLYFQLPWYQDSDQRCNYCPLGVQFIISGIRLRSQI